MKYLLLSLFLLVGCSADTAVTEAEPEPEAAFYWEGTWSGVLYEDEDRTDTIQIIITEYGVEGVWVNHRHTSYIDTTMVSRFRSDIHASGTAEHGDWFNVIFTLRNPVFQEQGMAFPGMRFAGWIGEDETELNFMRYGNVLDSFYNNAIRPATAVVNKLERM